MMEEPSELEQLRYRSAINRVPLCGCGSGQWDVVLAMLERAAASPKPDGASFYDPMPGKDLSGRAVEIVAHALDHVGLLEHGSTIGFAWLTPGGELLLRFLQKYGIDHERWPEWAESCPVGERFSLTDEEWNRLRDS